MKDENLAKHCKLKHNAAKRVLGEESVSGYFATSAKKPRENENPSSAGSSQGEMLLLIRAAVTSPCGPLHCAGELSCRNCQQ